MNSKNTHALHKYLKPTSNAPFSMCEKSLRYVIHPLCIFRVVKRIVFGLGAGTQSSFVIPHSRAAIPNDIPPSGCLMKTKALFEKSLLSGRNYAHVLVSV